MEFFSRLKSLAWNLFGQRRVDQDLDAEINSYIEERSQSRILQGAAPAEALRQAHLEVGGAEQVKERVRTARTGSWIQAFWQDLKFGARLLRKTPGFAVTCVLTFAIGIGANTAIFSMVNGLLFRPLAAESPEQLIYLVEKLDGEWSNGFSYPDFEDIRAQGASAFSDIAGFYNGYSYGLTVDGTTQQFWADSVTPNFFSLMGVRPVLGRLFTAGRGARFDQADPVLVLAYDFWKSHMGGDPHIIGKKALVNGCSLTVIGVAPEGFHGASNLIGAQGFLPLGLSGSLDPDAHIVPWTQRDQHFLQIIGRLRAGVSARNAQAIVSVIAQRLAAAYPEHHKQMLIRPVRLGVGFMNSTGENPMGLASALFLLLSGLVMLLAAANITNLLFARSIAHNREMALRSALGAARLRLVRQALTETFLLVFLGCLAGLALGMAASRILAALPLNTSFPLLLDFSFDWRVFFAAIAAALVMAAASGIVPALRASAADANGVLREGTRHSGSHRGGLRTMLVGAQVAASVTLLIVAGLFARSLQHTANTVLGFNPDHLLNLTLDAHGAGYAKSQGEQFYSVLLGRVQSLPGVESASLAQNIPMGDESFGAALKIQGYHTEKGRPQPFAGYDTVSPEFLRTLGATLILGRDILPSDAANSQPVAVINQAMAERYWPRLNPLGKEFTRLDDPKHPMQVVGVVNSLRMDDLFFPVQPFFFMPLAQNYVPRQMLQVRAAGAPSAMTQPILDVLRHIGPAVPVPVYAIRTMNEVLDGINGLFLLRLGAGLAAALGALGLTLAVVGVYGVISYSAAQRTCEIGIRMALGAQRRQVLSTVLRQGIWITCAGVLSGVVTALAIAKLVGSFLVGISAFDPLTFITVSGFLAAVALLASFVPAACATRVDPMLALRHE